MLEFGASKQVVQSNSGSRSVPSLLKTTLDTHQILQPRIHKPNPKMKTDR